MYSSTAIKGYIVVVGVGEVTKQRGTYRSSRSLLSAFDKAERLHIT